MIFHDKDFSKISGDPCWLFIFKEKRCELNFKEMWLVCLIAWWCFLDIFICAALISQSRILWFQYSRRQEVQPVHPKGDQSWVFIGRTDGKTETPILWPPHAKSWLIEKTLMLGGIGGRRRRGNRGWDGWVASPTRWTWVSVNSGSWWWTGRPGVLRFMGHKELDTTEWLNWTELRRQVGHRAGPKLIYRFISLKILAKFYFCKLNKIILKFISKGIRHRILKTILKKK